MNSAQQKDIEIEIQVRVSNKDALEAFLQKEATVIGTDYQKDEYFMPAHRDFTTVKPIVEWLRLRESNGYSITYKKWHHDTDGSSRYCDEYETKFDSIESIRKIFAAIDMRPLITIEKTRRTWQYKDYEVAIDDVAGLGVFVEVEYKGHDPKPDPRAITDAMIAWLKKSGCGTIEINYVGYPFMMLYPDEVRFEKV
jgi:adenylate cyclase, class 2